MNSINVFKLKELLDTDKIKLIDVREDEEINICNISGSLHIPMGLIPEKAHDLNKELTYAVMCHSGVRSLYASEYLKKSGFTVFNVEGGIDSWAVNIDTEVKRY